MAETAIFGSGFENFLNVLSVSELAFQMLCAAAIFVIVIYIKNDNIMEGILWKWTNYWNGWQMRWFVLDNGVLAYYKSQEEVNQGCKGSMKVSACEIAVHPSDNTRLDIIVPGEQHIYLKAVSNQERQRWLVALGSSKACVTTRSRKESGDLNPDSLRSKRSELKLYCNLLMQQVHQVKTCATEEGSNVNVKKLNDASSLLAVTCDTFIKTLDDCMKLSEAQFLELPHQHLSDVPLPQGHYQRLKPVMKKSSSCDVSECKSNDKTS